MENNINPFVYYRGDKDRGNEIINALEMLGGNAIGYSGKDPDMFYYIDAYGNIDIMGPDNCEYLLKHYTEAFLPNYFKPFDKVIVRNKLENGNFNDIWTIDFFSYIKDSVYYCISGKYKECMRYNSNTHKLIGTNYNYNEID